MHLFHFPFLALGGENEIQIYAANQEQAQQYFSKAKEAVLAIERKYSRYIPESVLSNINAQAGGDALEVDQETAALLSFAATCYEQSDALFDATSGILRRVWDFKNAKVPSQYEIDQILPLIGWNKVEWHAPKIRLPLTGMQLDFGGFGKEYAVDKAAQVLLEAGVAHALVNLGGDLKIVGAQLDGQAWKVGIKHPRRESDVLLVLDLFSGSLATSGDYQRYFEKDGKRYCHILNPKKGWPVNSFQSVSVLADSCLVAGAASSIAMLYEEEQGLEFLDEIGLPYIAVCPDGRLLKHLK